MSALKILTVAYVGGAVIFGLWLAGFLLNILGLTTFYLPVWPMYLGFALMMGSKYIVGPFLLKRNNNG